MRVAITGHTKGLGKELYNRFGDVKGFSSSNDYDVSDRYDRAKIINEIHKFDLFINNAHPFFDQTTITYLKDLCILLQKHHYLIFHII